MKNKNKKSHVQTHKINSGAIVKYRMRNFNTKSIENSYEEYKKLGFTCSTVKLLEDKTDRKNMKVFYKFSSITLNNCLNYCRTSDNCIWVILREPCNVFCFFLEKKSTIFFRSNVI